MAFCSGPAAGPATKFFEERFQNASPLARVGLIETLAQAENEHGAARSLFEKAQSDGDPKVRFHAARANCYLSPIAVGTNGASQARQNAIPVFVELLNDPQLAVDAARELGRIGSDANPAISPLKRLIQSAPSDAQVYFAIALWNIEKDTQIILPVLLEAVGSEDDLVRASVAQVLCEIAPESKGAADALFGLYDDPSFAVRWHAKQCSKGR